MESKPDFDKSRAEAFAGTLIDVLNKSALSLMISIGHRSGLFDTMSEMDAATSSQIADNAGLNERYVREWLGAMVTGGLVEYDAQIQTYCLPAEHAAYLTRAAGSDNIAVFTQYTAVMGQVEDDVLQCFKEGGGVP
jgi:hypothetical protein